MDAVNASAGGRPGGIGKENRQWAPSTDKVLRIRMLTLPHDIVVPMEQFEVGQQ